MDKPNILFIKKSLKSFNIDVNNINAIIDVSFPILFYLKNKNLIKICFISNYEKSSNYITFFIADSTYETIIDFIENDKNITDLFKNSYNLKNYSYKNGYISEFKLNKNKVDLYLPSNCLSAWHCINLIDKNHLLSNLK